MQPESISDSSELCSACARLIGHRGGVLRKAVEKALDLPRLGCINIHASCFQSIGAPIQHAILSGIQDRVTLMYMFEGLDEGDIAKRAVPIGKKPQAN